MRALVGPTGVGKTALAIEVAERVGAEVLSMDSMLVYRGMDVGTAKPDAAERARVPHHLIDLVDPAEVFTVAHWLRAAEAVEFELTERGGRALYAGGTAFYLQALIAGLFEGPEVDPALRGVLDRRWASEGGAALHAELAAVDPRSADRIHPNDAKRVVRALEVHRQTGRPLSALQDSWGIHGEDREALAARQRPRRLVGLTRSVEGLDRRIRARTEAMLDAGWVEEARAIRARGGFSKTAVQALGYRDVLALADGRIDRATCVDRIALATRQFARRQRTWLRRFGEIHWVDLEACKNPADRVDGVVSALGWSPR